METLEVLRVELEGITTSFRYPHFLVGRQPSLPFPPPATILGHIASALGEYPDPTNLRFSYVFSYSGQVDDLETQHILQVSTRNLDKRFGAVKNLEGSAGPSLRQTLLWPKLTLYISSPEIQHYLEAFRQPRYAVVLGRSQDLATYTDVRLVRLEHRSDGYFENTILPNRYRDLTNAGVLTQMARYINPNDRRRVDWEMYLTLDTHISSSSDPKARNKTNIFFADPEQDELFLDPESPIKKGQKRLVLFQSFVAENVRV